MSSDWRGMNFNPKLLPGHIVNDVLLEFYGSRETIIRILLSNRERKIKDNPLFDQRYMFVNRIILSEIKLDALFKYEVPEFSLTKITRHFMEKSFSLSVPTSQPRVRE